MSGSKIVKRDLYYTNDHEWIDFRGTVAYIGVCNLKLSGINQIQKIVFAKNSGFKKQGEVVATIHGKNFNVILHMPADGKVMSLNDKKLLADRSILLDQSENDGWMALIGLSQPYERKGLMQLEQYKLFSKRKI